jgi:hypothetical protein
MKTPELDYEIEIKKDGEVIGHGEVAADTGNRGKTAGIQAEAQR